MNTSKKSNRINVTNPVYAVLKTDTTDLIEYEEVKSFGKAMQVQITPTAAIGSLYGNGNKEEDVARMTGITLAIDFNKVFIETRAELLGNKYEDGVLIEMAGDAAPYIAVGFEIEQTGGSKEQVWLLKGKTQPINNSVQQATDSINFSTDSLVINFIPREKDKKIRFFGDTANENYTEGQADKFFTTGPVEYPKPAIRIIKGE